MNAMRMQSFFISSRWHFEILIGFVIDTDLTINRSLRFRSHAPVKSYLNQVLTRLNFPGVPTKHDSKCARLKIDLGGKQKIFSPILLDSLKRRPTQIERGSHCFYIHRYNCTSFQTDTRMVQRYSAVKP